jgi:hypothetical protein
LPGKVVQELALTQQDGIVAAGNESTLSLSRPTQFRGAPHCGFQARDGKARARSQQSQTMRRKQRSPADVGELPGRVISCIQDRYVKYAA